MLKIVSVGTHFLYFVIKLTQISDCTIHTIKNLKNKKINNSLSLHKHELTNKLKIYNIIRSKYLYIKGTGHKHWSPFPRGT
jgi:Na+/phosphate symporter